MLGPLSPGRSATRRRRLIDGVVGTLSGGMSAEHFYAAVPNNPSASSSRRRGQPRVPPGLSEGENGSPDNLAETGGSGGGRDVRKAHTGKKRHGDFDGDAAIPLGFRPIDPKADHSYRIAVAEDGSMITAVPIRNQHRRSDGPPPPRSSPILYSDKRASRITGRDSSPYSASTVTTAGGSRRGLLDVRGKQRNKMKLMAGPAAVVARATGRTGHVPRHVPQVGNGNGKRRLTKARGLALFGNGAASHDASGLASRSMEGRGSQFDKINSTDIQAEKTMGLKSNRSRLSQTTKTRAGHDAGKATVRFDAVPSRNASGKHANDANSPSLPQAAKSPATPSWTNDDASVTSFPVLSPLSKFDSFEERPKEAEAKNETNTLTNTLTNPDAEFTHQIKITPSSNSNTHPKSPPNENPTPPPPNSFEALLRHRILEIQSRQAMLAKEISKKETIEQTIVSAIDQNLAKKRTELHALDEELKVIQWHLDLDAQKAQRPPPSSRTSETPSPDNDHDGDDDPLLSRRSHHHRAQDPNTANTAYDMDSIGDPSLTLMDSVTVDDSLTAAATANAVPQHPSRHPRHTPSRPPVRVTGMDPPARSSPPHVTHAVGVARSGHRNQCDRDREYGQRPVDSKWYRNETNETDGPCISGVGVFREDTSRGSTRNENSGGGGGRMRIPKPIRPKAPSLKASLLKHQNSDNTVSNRTKRKKFVHFHLPHDDESSELRFHSSPQEDDEDVAPSAEFSRLSLEENFRTPLLHPRSEEEEDDHDDEGISSWKGEHYDVDVYDEDTGKLVAKEHFDSYQWRDKEHHLVTNERYSTENHHHYYRRSAEDDDSVNQRTQPPSPIPPTHFISNPSGYRGISSGSVETDPDLSFIHSVAAIVIQTAVRRFLAEIAAVERMYAVQVLQNAVRHWMAQRHNLYYYRSSPGFENGYSYGPTMPSEYPSPRKQVTFRDDFTPLYDFAATEIQRCFRGWWVRDGLEVDHFAAATIQRVFRGWWVREGLALDDYCAVEIQRMVRGHLCRMSYIYDLYCIIVVQSVVRRYIAFYTSAVRLANIIYIQAIYRGYRVRADLMRYVMHGQEVAATLIQAQWRCYDAQMNYINTLADILIAQSVIRRWLVLRRVKAIKVRIRKKQKLQQRQARSKHDQPNHVDDSKPGWQEEWQNRRKKNIRPMNSISFQNNEPADSNDSGVATRDGGAEELSLIHGIDGVDWCDGNKSEASDMLRSWKDRSIH